MRPPEELDGVGHLAYLSLRIARSSRAKGRISRRSSARRPGLDVREPSPGTVRASGTKLMRERAKEYEREKERERERERETS